MPDFAFTAMAETGVKSTGVITAGSEREAAAQLDAKGLFPITIGLTSTSAGGGGGGIHFGKVANGRQLSTLYSQLADLLHSGVPLLRSLELLEKQCTKPRLQSVLRDVKLNVADGKGLAQSMAQHPKVFNELVVSMVRAGQEGGFLEDVLKRTAGFVEHQEELKSKVMGALAYPVFLMVAGTSILLALVMFFVPKFKKMFEKLEAQGELPTLTQIVLGFSAFLLGYWYLIIIGLVLLFTAYYFWINSPKGRYTMDAFRIRVPLFGKIYVNLALSRFCRILGTMLHNGIPILKALNIAKDSTGNKVLTMAIAESVENITAGQKLADPLRRNKYFPTDMVEMVAIAEESNNLEKVLIDIADSMERRTTRNMDLMVKLLEPMMLLMMACAVLFVVLGLLLPVFKMGQVVGK